MSSNIEGPSTIPSTDRRTSVVADPARRWPGYHDRARAETLPPRCPTCGAAPRWTHYRLIPGAPAVACGWCNHTVFVTERVYLDVQAGNKVELPKAAAGQIKRKVRG